MEVKINREIRNYTESMFFGLSLRQFIFSVLACGVAVAQHHITNVASDSYTLDWNAKTISITAYPETKAESRLINEYIADSSTKFKRVIQPA